MPRLPRKPDEPLGSLSSVALSCSSVKQLHCITEWWLVIQRYSCCPNQGEHFTPPATAFSGGDLGVAGSTERHEVRLVVRPALRQRDDVMHLLRWGDSTVRLATLTQRVSSDEAVTQALPRSAVALLHSGVTLVAFVTLSFLLGMLLAEACVGQP